MIKKPGKSHHEVDSYRPISLLAGFSKIFEVLLMKRMFRCKDFEDAVPAHQFGFRRGHSTEQQLFRVTQFIQNAFKQKLHCSAVFIDVSEAFDRVWHQGLLLKLAKLLPYCLLKTLDSYLTNRTFIVNGYNGHQSRIGTIAAGVPQGSVLGPILYTIYTADMPLPSSVERTLFKEQVDHKFMLLSTYADDTIIMCADKAAHIAINTNTTYLYEITEWASDWGITLNANKTVHVMFSNRTVSVSRGPKAPLIHGKIIQSHFKHRYLGLLLDKRLKLNHHTTQLANRVRASAYGLNWILGKQSKLPAASKALLYKQMIAPIWHYALPVWGPLVSKTQFKKIEVSQNKILRWVVQAGRYTRNKVIQSCYKVKSAQEVLDDASGRLANSLYAHPNAEARNLLIDLFTPNNQDLPVYSKQLETHFAPLRQLLLQQPEQHQQVVPTLIRLDQQQQKQYSLQQDQLRVEQQENNARQRQELAISSGTPQERPSIDWVNHQSRLVRSGSISRWDMARKIRFQPEYIQRLIMSPLLPSEIQPPTPEEQLEAGLNRLKLRLEKELLDTDDSADVANTATRPDTGEISSCDTLGPPEVPTHTNLAALLPPGARDKIIVNSAYEIQRLSAHQLTDTSAAAPRLTGNTDISSNTPMQPNSIAAEISPPSARKITGVKNQQPRLHWFTAATEFPTSAPLNPLEGTATNSAAGLAPTLLFGNTISDDWSCVSCVPDSSAQPPPLASETGTSSPHSAQRNWQVSDRQLIGRSLNAGSTAPIPATGETTLSSPEAPASIGLFSLLPPADRRTCCCPKSNRWEK
ncbi:uncharacterized protein LOC123037898 [Drosophila rhopaloa]|uniref:Reverse transcriptase domain-containing protein n=1 Tax=Drosophila rhopaloa TaxID=1041015 RepID=A0ABM5JCW3_DRORH|nr:uncharacterized protein LOC123037896 [Drosophila rhopaloa]XP_044316661.1 uncharacterized protein LOC123037898 [Drosophila rhopaloa]